MSGKVGRCVIMALSTAIVGFVGIGSDQQRAFSQVSGGEPEGGTSEPAYATDHILVKPESQAPAGALDRIEAINGARDEETLPIASVQVAELPAGLSVAEAVNRYEADPAVAYAEPDYKIYPAQATEPDPNEPPPSDPTPTDPDAEPAPSEPDPTDPAPDEPVAIDPASASPRLVPVTPNDPGFDDLYGLNNTGQTVNGAAGTADADIDAPEAWSVTTGSAETVVAVLDTGVDINHRDLDGNIWTNPDEVAGNGLDDDGNGYVDDIHGWDFAHNDATIPIPRAAPGTSTVRTWPAPSPPRATTA